MVELDGDHLTIEQVLSVAAGRETSSLSAEATQKMLRSREVVERLAAGDQPVYGVNTGVGLLADVRVPPADLDLLQRNVVRSHAAGTGDPLARNEVRAMMLIRANVLAKGFSGIRPVVAQRLCQMLDQGVTPIVPSQGSVGASGDHLRWVSTAGNLDSITRKGDLISRVEGDARRRTPRRVSPGEPTTAPTPSWAGRVTAHEAALRSSRGSFSSSNRPGEAGAKAGVSPTRAPPRRGTVGARRGQRRSGQ